MSFIIPQSAGNATAYKQALDYVEHHQLSPAIALLRKILDESPSDVKAHNLMGIALTASGRREEANEEFRKALEVNREFYPALKNLSMNELAQGHADQAEWHLQQVLIFAPHDPVVHLSLGEIYFARRQFALAVEHYLHSGGLYLKNAHVILNFARSCTESNQADKAVGALEALGPHADGKSHFQAGLMLAELGKYESAARQFELARKDYPDPYEAGYNLTLAYVRSRNYSAAIRTARELISQGYQRAELYNLLSEAYEGNGQTLEAYNALRTATQIEPGDEDNYLDLVALGIDHRNYELALGVADIGLQNIPQSYRLFLQRGAVRAFKGQFALAMEDFKQASQLDPKKNLPYYAMAMALMQKDQMREAIILLRRRLSADPEDPMMLFALGQSLIHSGVAPGSNEEAEALRCLKKSIRLNSGLAQSHFSLGIMLLKRNDVAAAIAELEKALALDPADLTPCYQLSLAYRKKGDKQRAEELLAKFERFKIEDRERTSNRTILRLLREGEK